jgi:uncharacterized RDD family membrane protein YckC
MATINEGWYIAEPDGTTIGPLTRGEFSERRLNGGFSAGALAWHVDMAEWRPLARIAITAPTRAGAASRDRAAAHVENVAAKAQDRAKPSKAERKALRAAAQAAQSTAPVRPAAPAAKAASDDGRRLLQGAALARAAARPAAMPGAKPLDAATLEKEADAKEGAARLALGMRRLVARLLDTLTLGMLGAVVLYALAMRAAPGIDWPTPGALLWIAVFGIVPLAALSLALAGRTPAKALLGLETRAPDGAKPSLVQAFLREIDVMWRGMGLGIPPFTLVAVVVAATRLSSNGEATWDQRQRLTTRAAGDAKWQPALIALIAAFYLLGTDVWMQLFTWLLTL